ncbi:hypothetical protein ACSSNL_01610 [Thalassobius sp. S69A]|uniref:hypothetical protein n=1 Tax=unclassified Thalassovita TaxID=2619711 RepID=UPI000C0E2E14|nr:hypothetical protein [Paracoccaceae bacterium]MBA85753.1 hypothetical protein [Paracoccaceae bacterium]MBT26848.1 hypothetical protein [Paracoccaceae bacterium]
MDTLYDVTLIGPAKINGKHKGVGDPVQVAENDLRLLVKAKAVAPSALEKLGDPETEVAPSKEAELAGLQQAYEELGEEFYALSKENARLTEQVNNLTAQLTEAEADKTKLAGEIAKADRAIEAMKAELPGPAEEKAAAKPTAKSSSKTAAKTTDGKQSDSATKG